MTSMLVACPKCGTPTPQGASGDLCPKCLVTAAASEGAPPLASNAASEYPTLERVAAAFPKLEILELVGRGGMGFVFKARQPHLNRLVALKLLSDRLARDPNFSERFQREGRVLARLSHPNIVSVYDFGMTAHLCFLLMEFVDGRNLRQAMQAGRIPLPETLRIVSSVCAALQCAHEQKILHRDIKPANILLDHQGRVKIADFGIAKLVGDEKADAALTATGATLGTPHYMAPEQLQQPSAVDHRADIYSLGVVFYEMLTGELPIGRFAAPSSKAAVNTQVDEAIFRALEKDPKRRFQSAHEMQSQIERLQEEGNAAPGAGSASAGFERRSRWMIWGAGLSALILCIGVILFLSLKLEVTPSTTVDAASTIWGLGLPARAATPSSPPRPGEVLAYQWLKSPSATNTTNAAINFVFTNVELRHESEHDWLAIDYATDVRGNCEEVFLVDGNDYKTRKQGLLVTPEGSPPVLRQRFEWQVPPGLNKKVVSDLTDTFAKALVGKSFLVPAGEQRPLLRFPVGATGDVSIGIGTRLRDTPH